MTSRHAALFTLLAFACATEPEERAIMWQKAGASVQELDADRTECESLATPKQPSGGEAEALERHNAVISCMKNRGWAPSP